MTVNSLFAVPVMITKLDLHQDARRALVQASFTERFDYDHQRTAVGGWQSKPYMESRHHSFVGLRDRIQWVIKENIYALGFESSDKGQVFNLWSNILDQPGGYNQPHVHGSGAIYLTGVYYPCYGLDDDLNYLLEPATANGQLRSDNCSQGDLMLFDPSHALKGAVDPLSRRKQPFSGKPWFFTPTTDYLLVFPVYLTHMVAPIAAHYTRISISFAYGVK